MIDLPHFLYRLFDQFEYCITPCYTKVMPSPVRFAEVKRLLEAHGWTLSRISSSHHIFAKPGEAQHFSIPVHKGMVKYGYLREIKKRLNLRQERS